MPRQINKQIKRAAQLELARRDLFYFCKLRAPAFYKDDRPHLVRLCSQLQEFYESPDEKIFIINEPPRHGKSRTMSLATQWFYGQNKKEKIILGSYNETLSTTFSQGVRNGIGELKADEDIIVYSDIFPDVRIQRGDAAVKLWSLEGQGTKSYLATSPSGTTTGFGASLIIIDDLIKDDKEAFNENVLEAHWRWFTDTMLSRLEEGGKIIIIMTRWSSNDLAGKAIEFFEKNGIKVRKLIEKALQDDGTMLCPDILSYESFKMKFSAGSEEIASANYQQQPIDLKGRLYQGFKTYLNKPKDGVKKCYIDTADKGSDFLCGIVYEDVFKEAYIDDILYTKEPMSITEEKTAEMLFNNDVRLCIVESNNGGEGFARNVRRILLEKYKSNKCVIKTFHQTKNKQARILSSASWIEEHMYFPDNWRDRWPDYYKAMFKYQKEGKNAHDDAQDATTGVAEQFNKTSGTRIGG